MDVTRENISHILDLTKISCHSKLVSNLADAVVVCAILEGISGLEPSLVITEPRYLNNNARVGHSYNCFFITRQRAELYKSGVTIQKQLMFMRQKREPTQTATPVCLCESHTSGFTFIIKFGLLWVVTH